MGKIDIILEYGLGGEKLLIPKAKADLKSALLECVPEEKARPIDCCNNEGGAICWKESKVKSFNECRQQVLDNINQLFEGDV